MPEERQAKLEPAQPWRHQLEQPETAEQERRSVPYLCSGCWWPSGPSSYLATKLKERQLEPAVEQLALPARIELPRERSLAEAARQLPAEKPKLGSLSSPARWPKPPARSQKHPEPALVLVAFERRPTRPFCPQWKPRRRTSASAVREPSKISGRPESWWFPRRQSAMASTATRRGFAACRRRDPQSRGLRRRIRPCRRSFESRKR